MTNAEIERHTHTFVAALMKDELIKPADKTAIDAGVAILVNLLQNINEIAANGAVPRRNP